MPDPTSLEAQERNVRCGRRRLACAKSELESDPGINFRHSGWDIRRQKIREALDRCNVSQGRLEAWDGCGMNAWVLRSRDDDGALKIAGSSCKDRFCVPCADSRSSRIGNRIRAKIPPEGISFLTLTLADTEKPLRILLDKLLASFRRLRQWQKWKDAVAGGVAFVEIKWSNAKTRWHPHLHVVMEADYLPQDQISARWRRVTHGSFIVDIRRPKNAETVIRYICKYGSKPLDQSFVANPDRLDEAIQALKGRHLCMAFGAWRGWALVESDDTDEWIKIDSLSNLLDRERRGDPEAINIMEQLRCATKRPIPIPTRERSPPPLDDWQSRILSDARASALNAAAVLRSSLGCQSAA